MLDRVLATIQERRVVVLECTCGARLELRPVGFEKITPAIVDLARATHLTVDCPTPATATVDRVAAGHAPR